ncbi:MAG TPA: glycosyltransferase [Stenomitos sp.]
MRVLFISSSHYPEKWSNYTNGSLRRKKVFFDALKNEFEIDLLYYVPLDIEIGDVKQQCAELEIRQEWKASVNCFFCHYSSLTQNKKWVKHFSGIFGFFQQWKYYRVAEQQQILALEECLKREPDLIFAQRLESMVPLLLTQKPLPPILFDLDDVEHVRFVRQLQYSPSLLEKLFFLHVPARFWGEYRAIKRSSMTFVCSQKDQDYLSKTWKLPRVHVVPNSIEIPQAQELCSQPNILFLGSYAHPPNVFAADFLIEKIWPLIQARLPAARLMIAGEQPENIRAYGRALTHVEFLGFVPDLEALYLNTRLVCCPVFSGAGTRVKIVEASAYGKPIVSTRMGAEGLAVEDSKQLLLRDDPVEFAQACIQVLLDDTLALSLGTAARAAAIQYYNSEAIQKCIRQHIAQVLERH